LSDESDIMCEQTASVSGASDSKRSALVGWIRFRVLCVGGCFIAAALGWLIWQSAENKALGLRKYGVRVKATVKEVEEEQGLTLFVTYYAHGKVESAEVDPNRTANWRGGDVAPIIYNSRDYSQAVYAGPGGDSSDGRGERRLFGGAAVVFGAMGAIILADGAARLLLLARSARQGRSAPAMRVQIAWGTVRLPAAWKGRDLSWRILADQVAGQAELVAHVRGRIAPGSWLVLDTGQRLVWPVTTVRRDDMSSRPGSFVAARPELRSLKEAHAALLSAYASVLVEAWDTAALSVRARVTDALVKAHVRSKLAELAAAYVRQAALGAVGDKASDEKVWLASARQECDELRTTTANTSGWGSRLRVAAPVVGQGLVTTAGLAAAGAFLAALIKRASHALGGSLEVPIYILGVAIVAMVGWLGLRAYRAVFRDMRGRLAPPDMSEFPALGRMLARSTAVDRNCYKMEDTLFSLLGQPKKLEVPRDVQAADAFWAFVTLAGAGYLVSGVITSEAAVSWIVRVVLVLGLFYWWLWSHLDRRDEALARAT
jgi:hypothetical protein